MVKHADTRCRSGPTLNGFTLIELLVALAIVGLLMSIVAPRYFASVGRAEETVLKQNLALLRDAIDKHYADTGRYPQSLDELVTRRYMRSVPLDPVAKSTTAWIVIPPEGVKAGAVYDVRSAAQGVSRDGRPYEQW